MTLHEAMEAALARDTLTIAQLAQRIRRLRLYRKRDGGAPGEKQIALRALSQQCRGRFEVLIRRK